MQTWVDVGERGGAEVVDVVREPFGEERVGGRGRHTERCEQSVGSRHRRSEHGERVEALLIDVGRQHVGELLEQASRLGPDHHLQRRPEPGGVETAGGGRLDRDPPQPRGGHLGGDLQEFPGRLRVLHIAIHPISSIVRPVSPLTPRRNLGTARSIGAVAVVTALALVGCTGGDDDVAPSTTVTDASTTTTTIERPNDGVLKIGLFLPRTGEGAQLGEPMIGAITDAVDLINEAGGVFGTDVEIEIVDSGAGTGPDALLSNGVDAIIGPASSRLALTHLASMTQPSTGVVTCSPTATAVALDDFPDNGFFFRTVPSDTLQMSAIARRVQDTGFESVAVGYLDDPYGRGLVDRFADAAAARGLEIQAQVGFGGEQDDLSAIVAELVAGSPSVIVVLGDADDGSRLLAALDGAAPDQLRRVIVNDAIRNARATIQSLSENFVQLLVGVAPAARSQSPDGPPGFFTAHAADCVNLIALAAVVAGSDSPTRIKSRMGEVASGGRVCTSFAACVALLDQDLQIDYKGASGSVDLSNSAGDPVRAWFETFGFNPDGTENNSQLFEIP